MQKSCLLCPNMTTLSDHAMAIVVFQREPDVALQMSVKSNGSALADIIRRSSVFYEAAQRVGLQVTDDIPMPPTRAYMDAVPRYRGNGGVSMTRLLRFTA